MKHLINRALGLGAAIIGLASCTSLVEDRQELYTSHTVTIEANSAGTKTTITEGLERATFKWSADDAARFVVKENDIDGTGITLSSSDSYETMSLEATFAGPDSESYTYTAFMSANKHTGYPLIPATQTCTSSGYDPDADILTAQSVSFNSRQDHLTMCFARPVVINKMTLRGLTEGETISAIEISADKDITGYYSPSGNEWTGQSSKIYLTTSQVVPASGEITVYFVSMPVEDAVLTVSATSANYLFKKTFARGISFIQDKVTTFGVSGLTRISRYKTDVLNQTLIGQSGTAYADFSAITATSTAVYAGNSAAGYNSIQLRSNNNTSGVVTTASGGIVTRVTVSWNSNTTSGRTLQIYGKHTAYSSASDLYNALSQGTLLGTIVYGTSTQLTISGEYEYIGLRSSSGAMYLDDVSITWLSDSGATSTATASVNTVTSAGITFAGATLYGSFSGATGAIYETGFYWGTDPDNLDRVATTDGMSGSSGEFCLGISGLEESTTYYYKAYVLEYNQSTSSYEDRFADNVLSFTTGSKAAFEVTSWLELPTYSVSNLANTTTSPLNDLYQHTHYATMGGKTARNYTVLYDPAMYASYWVAYPLCHAHQDGSGRSDAWAYDPYVPNAKQTNAVDGAYGTSFSTENYSSNLYSRGHQVPNADRNGVDDMCDQTYYMTNITPQLQNGFNSGIWGNLETAVRGLTASCDTVYVVTGAAFRKATDGTESITTITNKRDGKTLPVPNYYWKALLKVERQAGAISNATAIGFWLPHADLKGQDYRNYAVTVDQIEEWTGVNLFGNLPEVLQTAAEANSNWSSFSTF